MIFAEISHIAPRSPADKSGLRVGDKILAVNIDISFAFAEKKLSLSVERANGKRETVNILKRIDENLGADFTEAVFDGVRRCRNNCLFCFVNMIAPDMRRSLSVKDDDYRLSFLYGNFITLTNMREEDFGRIRRLNLSPLYVSVHCTDGETRAKLLRNPEAAKIGEQLDRLEEAMVEYHTQVVLCRGINDGEILEKTIADIYARRPAALSMAVVPVGVTKFRRDKAALCGFDKNSAAEVIKTAEKWQEKFRNETGETFLYLSDEFYILARKEFPPVEYYDDFPQIENGIGMARNFIDEWENAEVIFLPYEEKTTVYTLCGEGIAAALVKLKDKAVAMQKNLIAHVLPVKNEFFGGTVNVSGLLTAADLKNAIKPIADNADGILIPATALRKGGEVFLDDVSLPELQGEFPQVKILPVARGDEYKQVLLNFRK